MTSVCVYACVSVSLSVWERKGGKGVAGSLGFGPRQGMAVWHLQPNPFRSLDLCGRCWSACGMRCLGRGISHPMDGMEAEESGVELELRAFHEIWWVAGYCSLHK